MSSSEIRGCRNASGSSTFCVYIAKEVDWGEMSGDGGIGKILRIFRVVKRRQRGISVEMKFASGNSTSTAVIFSI